MYAMLTWSKVEQSKFYFTFFIFLLTIQLLVTTITNEKIEHAFGYWGRSSSRQAAGFISAGLDDGDKVTKILNFYEEDKRINYFIEFIGDTVSQCIATPMQDDQQFAYFDWLDQSQCTEYTKEDTTIEVWYTTVS